MSNKHQRISRLDDPLSRRPREYRAAWAPQAMDLPAGPTAFHKAVRAYRRQHVLSLIAERKSLITALREAQTAILDKARKQRRRLTEREVRRIESMTDRIYALS